MTTTDLMKLLAADGQVRGRQLQDIATLLRLHGAAADVVAKLLTDFGADSVAVATMLERAERRSRSPITSISRDCRAALFGLLGLPDGPVFTIYKGDEIAKLPQTPQLVLNRIIAESVVIVCAVSGAGKTFVEASLTAAITGGAPDWFGALINPAFRNQPVLYALAEGAGQFPMRLRAAFDHQSHGLNRPMFDTIPDSVLFLKQSCRLDDTASVEAFIRAAQPHKPCMVVLDTYQRHGGAEGEVEKVQLAIAHLDLIREELRCVVNVPHHLPKDGRWTPRGHGSIDASADTVLFLERKEDLITARFEQRDLEASTFTMQIKKVVMPDFVNPITGDPLDTLVLTTPSATAVAAIAKQTKKDDGIEASLIAAVKLTPGIGQSALLKEVKGKDATKLETLEKLFKSGKLDKEVRAAKAGRTANHYTVPPDPNPPPF